MLSTDPSAFKNWLDVPPVLLKDAAIIVSVVVLPLVVTSFQFLLNEIKTSLDLIKRGAVDFIQKNDNYFSKKIKKNGGFNFMKKILILMI